MSHQLPPDLHTFLNALQSSVGGVPINVSYNDSESWVVDYFITVGRQKFNLWHNVNVNGWGWEQVGFSHIYTQGFDEDSI